MLADHVSPDPGLGSSRSWMLIHVPVAQRRNGAERPV